MPLYAGVGGGIALNRCAAKFNRLKANEIRIEQDFQSVEAGQVPSNTDELEQRLKDLKQQMGSKV